MTVSAGQSIRAALLFLLLVATLLAGCAGNEAEGFQADPTPALTGAAGTATAEPRPEVAAVEPEQAADELDLIEQRVAEIRGIERPEVSARRFVTRQELQDYIAAELEDPDVVREIELEERLYKLLGMIDQDSHLAEVFADLLGRFVVGLYDTEIEEFLVLSETGDIGPAEEITYAHEYVHRLQDAEHDLSALQENAAENSDTMMALRALIEGDAVLTEITYAQQHIVFDFEVAGALMQAAATIEATAAQTPYVVMRSLEFPYVEGLQFAEALYAEGGYGRIDDAFRSPPVSTEQILHPEKYLDREEPIPVEVTVDPTVLGDGWVIAHTDTLGEFILLTWLEHLGATARAREGARGWGGDSYVLFENGRGESAMAAKLVWDDPAQDSHEFLEALTVGLDSSPDFEWLGRHGNPATWQGSGGVLAVEVTAAGEVLLSVAQEQATAAALIAQVGAS